MKTQTKFAQIFGKLILIRTKNSTVKSSMKSTLLSKDEKEFIAKNLEKFIKNFDKHDLKLREDEKFKQDKNDADYLKISVKKYRELKIKAYNICKCFNAGYSMGGSISLYIRQNKKSDCTLRYLENFDDRHEYSKNCRYKAIHGYNRITLTIKELEQIVIIGGIPTIKLTNDKISECLVLVGTGYKNNYNINFTKAFLTGTYHAKTYQECVDWRNKMYIQRLKERDSTLVARATDNRKRESLKRFVGFEHSIKVGNCEIGTKAFAQKHNLDIRFGYRLGYLMELEPTSPFVQKLINNFV